MIDALKGVRILDLTNVLAGPFCCHQLAHLGAEVIKIEVPKSGDLARELGADTELNSRKMGISFLAQNSGKRSITLNLKHPEGKALFLSLVKTADVLVENFRPGVMERLELGYTQLKAENPRLVYCAISGYGAEGPMKNLPAYDQIIQGMSGVMSITGAPENAPYRVGYPVSDTLGGLTAAFAISAALTGRHTSGEGSFIDVSMLESTLVTLGWVVSNYLMADKVPQPMGNDNFTASPSGTFKTQTGLINLAANKQEQFESVCRLIERTDLISDPRFSTRSARLENRTELKTMIEAVFATRPAGEWEVLLNQAGVPAGRVLTVPEALDLPQVRQGELEASFDKVPGVGREVRLVRTGFKVDGSRPRVERPPPALGEHTNELLTELGIDEVEQRRLAEEGVI